MDIEDAIAEIRRHPTVRPWPVAALALGLSRGGIYLAIQRGQVEAIRIGRRLRVVTGPLRRRLALDADRDAPPPDAA